MLRLSHIFKNTECESSVPNMESPQSSNSSKPIPESPQSMISSNPASPVTSLFSKTHKRFPSSVSSLASSPGTSGSTEAFSAIKTQLTEVKEEPVEPEQSLLEDDSYFPHFNDFHAPDTAADNRHISLESHGYDFSDEAVDVASSTNERRSENRHFRGISSISSRFSSLSYKWRHKSSSISDAAAALERYDESLRSRANSATSVLVTPADSSISARQSYPTSARTTFEERINEAGISPIDVEKANLQSDAEPEPQIRTPLLPPVMMDLPHLGNEAPIHSPLQSPSVADVVDSTNRPPVGAPIAPDSLPSPLVSAHPSMSSISRQLAMSRSSVTDGTPMRMSLSNDEWACKLGHANFTIQPEPYLPELSSMETFEEHRAHWELARCNYGKHLARTGEHYGVTSNIYKLTVEKWDSVNDQWKNNHDKLVAHLEDSNGNPLSLCPSDILRPGEAIKIPGLHDKEKFPDLGDEDIVGPMSVAPGPQQSQTNGEEKMTKRSIFKFFHGLFTPRQAT